MPNCPCGQKAFKAMKVLLNEVTMNQLMVKQLNTVLSSHDVVAGTSLDLDFGKPTDIVTREL